MLHIKKAELQNHPTPFYAYDLKLLRETLQAAAHAAGKYGYHIHYALKANSNEPILAEMQQIGFGADCVSGNEVKRALETGFAPEKVVFAGVGKSDRELRFALENDIFCFNVESLHELEVLNELAGESGKTARIALRINPNVNAQTHHYITTGLEENKFGINFWELEQVLELLPQFAHLQLIGLHFHIGSQITEMSVFRALCLRVNEIQQWFLNRNIKVEHLNVGGGLGVDYHEPETNAIPDFETYFGIFNEFLQPEPGQQVHFELGRALVAQSGTLISKVLYIKKGIKTNFIILDAGMTELIRPALYQSYHKIENQTSKAPEMRYDVVGPICESSDCFGKAVMLPETNRGDLLAIRTAGAYGEVMSSGYNLRDKAEAIYFEG
ncbi:diaminopimelate decarboxylase [Adhaeribacter soli]|uniref:Diaminopimelate decarboxylase n=1 Tax=Adhaeribacter soli TaxID=2607655 RepID=A0A5N1IWB7_9BACT|nr:diaminopimelate decarboxylase [Adhaeribacter soli]KAA9332749.1 diaminopimelate decarboxylase [Adhaeribacter soli]